MDQYYPACAPDPFTILGVKLKPFCIGHQILLKRFENAFSCDAPSITWKDLAHAILICSQSYESATETMDSPEGVDDYKRILKAIQKDFEATCMLMLEYIKAGRQGPENVNWKPGDPSHAAAEAVLKFVLMSKIGYTEERSLNMPYGQAVYEFCLWQQSEGTASFYDPIEKQELQDMADDFDARIKAQMTAQPEATDGQ